MNDARSVGAAILTAALRSRPATDASPSRASHPKLKLHPARVLVARGTRIGGRTMKRPAPSKEQGGGWSSAAWTPGGPILADSAGRAGTFTNILQHPSSARDGDVK